MFEMRPYQQGAVKAVFSEWQAGHNKTLLVLPTGTGKTIVFSKITEILVKEKHKRVLIIAHRGELLEQARDKLKASTGIDSALEKADESAVNTMFSVVVGSLQTLNSEKRLSRYKPNAFDVIIVDEAHHVLSDSYQNVLQYFNSADVLGVTATPDRGDKKDLAQYFDSLAYEYNMRDAIKSGYLCRIRVKNIPLKIDLGNAKVVAGDYTAKDIGNALDPYLEQIADIMQTECINRKTVVFLPLIETSQKFTRLLNERGFTACEINGNSTGRDQTEADFANGKYNVICNSMLLTEGWDCPSVDCVIVLRPTKVRALYCQMVGRGTRTFPGKKEMLLLDFLWHSKRHDLCRPISLFGSGINEEDFEMPDLPFDLLETVEQKERDAKREREESLARMIAEQSAKKKADYDLLERVYGSDINMIIEDAIEYDGLFGWENDTITKKQAAWVKRNLPEDKAKEIKTKGQASYLMNRMFGCRDGLATIPQIKALEKIGFINVDQWTMSEAGYVMDVVFGDIKKHIWDRYEANMRKGKRHLYKPERLRNVG